LEFLSEYGLFLAKTITFVVALIVLVGFVVSASMKGQHEERGHIEVNKINEKYDDMLDVLNAAILDEQALKEQEKQRKKAEKELKQANKKKAKESKQKAGKAKSVEANVEAGEDTEELGKPRVFIIDFVGDMKASATEELRRVITSILAVVSKRDEIVVRLESAGGLVHSYGLASSQLSRITSKEIPLTICVDKVAASGGYMMACVANKIIAAPFAVIGSIGVVAQLPNFHKILKKNDVDYEMLTAGEYKRTLTMFGENTEKGRKKFVDDLEDTHVLFKEFITEHRDIVDIDDVATGEIWFGSRALDKKLIDEVQTSDEYLYDKIKDNDIYEISFVQKKNLAQKVGLSVESALERVFSNWWQKLNGRIFTS